jgi:hypothetical protein
MNILGTAILVFLTAVVFSQSRRVALLGMMAGIMFLSQGQNINLFGLNLFPQRFLELAGFIRVMSRNEFSFRQLNSIDRTLLLLYAYTTVVFLLRSTEGVAYQIGIAVDAFLCYFIFRGLVTELDDFRWFMRAFVILLAPYAMIIILESMTGHNLFTLVGGSAGGGVWVRHDRPRCFGSFRQPDTLGMFGASFLPIFIGLACISKERKRALLGACLCLILVWAANSGGAAAGAGMGILGWLFWRFRTGMKRVRWGIVGMIVMLALVMKAPVWYIFAHISSITGGDGWHRSYLIDVAYRHLGKWCFAGMPISETSDWFPYDLATTGAADITNQFIAFGLMAGLGAVFIFVLLLSRAYAALGQAMVRMRSRSLENSEHEFVFWGMGVTLSVHIINWFGIAYFDQIYMVWFMQLAFVSALTQFVVGASAHEDNVNLLKSNDMQQAQQIAV